MEELFGTKMPSDVMIVLGPKELAGMKIKKVTFIFFSEFSLTC